MAVPFPVFTPPTPGTGIVPEHIATGSPVPRPQVPATGLIGSEQALQQALAGAGGAITGGINQARQDVSRFGQGAFEAIDAGGTEAFSQLNQGVGALQPFQQAGAQALNLQGALSGLQGQQAFDQALINSPAQQFLQQQGEQSILRANSAIGGLGGGNVRRELTRFGQGLASTNLQNQIGNLANISGQGLGAASNIGSLRGQGAGIAANLGTAGAGSLQQTGTQLANLAQQGGFGIGGLIQGTGSQLAAGRTQAGRDIAQNQAQTTSALSSLINQQGGGAADIIGGGAANIANLLQGFGGAQGASQEQLATLLANLATQQGTASASLPSQAQFLNNAGIADHIAALAEGAGSAATGFQTP